MGKPTFTAFHTGFSHSRAIWGLGPVWTVVQRYVGAEYIGTNKQTRGTETSQYPEERTSTETPRVVASEMGLGQCSRDIKPNDLERSAIAGESPVGVN